MTKSAASRGTILDKIAQATVRRIAQEKSQVSVEELKDRIVRGGMPFQFLDAFKPAGTRVIAEVKLRSPSAPGMGKGLDPLQVALDYERNGAAAISILTEPQFFGGSIDHLSTIREQVAVPLLMKDFVIDTYQILQARAAGANAILLIVALLGPEIRAMLREAGKWGLEALVEVHTESEMEAALSAGARLIGVNCRDLRTLRIQRDVLNKLAPMARGTGAVLVAESGIKSRADIDGLAAQGYRGFLIGTTFMKSGRPGDALARILEGKAA